MRCTAGGMDFVSLTIIRLVGIPELLSNACSNVYRAVAHGADRRPTASDAALDGQLAVITGGNAGVGLATAKLLRRRGADIILACR